MKLFLHCALLCFWSVLASTKHEPIYRSNASLYRPYIDRVTGRVVFGTLQGGCSVISTGNDAGVHLTQSAENSYGSITARKPISGSNWKLDVHATVKKGAKGMGIWVMKDFEGGSLFGGSEQFNGILVFLALQKNSLTDIYPSIGVATGYGNAPVVHFQKKIKMVDDIMISLRLVDSTLSVFYGGRNLKVELIDEMHRISIDDNSFVSISGQVLTENGDINIKTASFFKMHIPKRRGFQEDEIPKTKSKTTWLLLGALCLAVLCYLYTQRSAKPKHKGILQK
ncbi:uncharacterized protein NESG_02082 [Nematocida ausubeli]|uniref:L-type lectin-like domain-containing protein n=1 Tax=Nematocida ausubeli (strain ATCC PRA-371 / ERTm2) TaxID=1913371 RepID=A0A086IZJ3_NEMA1|nr:uncharacterized protein NESG_02082 [Nematocida ausubeli]KFG25311.1 hypothetical protein NESG_02082 [Nematocida ausubeli]